MISDNGECAAAVETAASMQREAQRRAESADMRLNQLVANAFKRFEASHISATQLANHVTIEAMRIGRQIRRAGKTPMIDLPRDATGRTVNVARRVIELTPSFARVQRLAILAFTCGYRAEHEYG